MPQIYAKASFRINILFFFKFSQSTFDFVSLWSLLLANFYEGLDRKLFFYFNLPWLDVKIDPESSRKVYSAHLFCKNYMLLRIPYSYTEETEDYLNLNIKRDHQDINGYFVNFILRLFAKINWTAQLLSVILLFAFKPSSAISFKVSNHFNSISNLRFLAFELFL